LDLAFVFDSLCLPERLQVDASGAARPDTGGPERPSPSGTPACRRRPSGCRQHWRSVWTAKDSHFTRESPGKTPVS